MNCYLAIDIGASGGRHIVGWLEEGKICTKEVYRFENGAEMKNGHLCWNAEGLFQHVIAGLKACGQQGYAPVSMGIDTWAVDFALLDSQGQLVGDLVAYRDSRTDGMDHLLEQQMPFSELYRITGIARQPFNTVYQMMAVLKEHPEYREVADDFLLVPEYLSYRLTGKKAHEWTNLSTTALMDAETHRWSGAVLKAANLPESWFQTPVVLPGTALGTLREEISREVGFDTTVILPATHDTGSAYMAVPAKDSHAAFLSSGTWSLLGMEMDHPVTDEGSMNAGFTNEGGWKYTTRFLKNIMGMWMLQCIRKETGKIAAFQRARSDEQRNRHKEHKCPLSSGKVKCLGHLTNIRLIVFRYFLIKLNILVLHLLKIEIYYQFLLISFLQSLHAFYLILNCLNILLFF